MTAASPGTDPSASSAASAPRPRRLHLYLIKPSKYDDEGYVIRHQRGVLPSNTLSTLFALTDALRRERALGEGVAIDTTVLDETVHRVDVNRIIRRARRRPGTRTVVALAGVQTNQFPRAADLAEGFRAAGLPVLIGGFHVSGLLALVPGIPADIRRLMDIGVTIVKGEVEETWGELLRDAFTGRLRPMYDFLAQRPDLYAQPIPAVPGRYMKRFAFSGFGTIDAGRGCPFDCSFCSIINVQGKAMRHRSAGLIADRIRRDYRDKGINFYFFTDDNFARNKNWGAIMDALIALRRDEGVAISFLMQVDTLSYRIPGFIARAKAAGCSSVFIGMESVNPKNLEAAGKTQNDADDYKNLIAAWHNAGIITHAGYILGFPHDTPESIREDVRRLKEEIGVDIVSFFILTPIPGSMDHVHALRDGVALDPDYNRYDSFHAVVRHPHFAPGELERGYREAWASFYSVENMKAVLARSNDRTYWDIFKNFIWYRSALIEGEHPMISGFFRRRDRRSRRPGFPVPGRMAHARRRLGETLRLLRAWWGLCLELEEVWLQTHARSRQKIEYVKDLQHRVADLLIQVRGFDRREMRQALIDLLHQFRGFDPREFRRHLDGIVQRAREFDARQALAGLAGPIAAIQRQIEAHEILRQCAATAAAAPGRAFGRGRGLRDRLNVVSVGRVTTRQPLARFWRQTAARIRRGALLRVNPFMVAVNLARDARLFAAFAFGVAAARRRLDNLEA